MNSLLVLIVVLIDVAGEKLEFNLSYSSTVFPVTATLRWNSTVARPVEPDECVVQTSTNETVISLPPSNSFVPSIVPIYYRLRLQLPTTLNSSSDDDQHQPIFFGSVDIQFRVTAIQRSFWVHSRNLTNFEQLRLVRGIDLTSKESIEVLLVEQHGDELIFRLGEALAPDLYTLSIGRYVGRISQQRAAGVFARKLEKNHMIATQFNPRFAKTLLPCVDALNAKAALQLSLIHPTNTLTVANSRALLSNRRLSNDWQLSVFEETPLISPHHFAFVILPSEYASLEKTTTTGITLRLHYNALRVNDSHAIIDAAADVFNRLASMVNVTSGFNPCFLIDEPLPIADIAMVMIPDYFDSLSNLGLITISEDDLLNFSDSLHRIHLLARLLTQQWIGGVSTIGAWSEVCVQDDLAEFLALKVVRQLNRDKSKWQQLMLTRYVQVQTVENLIAPGESLILSLSANESEHCFLKGVYFLTSLESMTGEAVLLARLRQFIAIHPCRTFRLEDAVRIFQRDLIDGYVNLAEVYDYWLKNGGEPSLLAERLPINSTLRLIQGNQGQLTQSGNGWTAMPLWPLPLLLRAVDAEQPTFLPIAFITSAGLELGPIPIENDRALLLNPEFRHFYRVNYDPSTWHQLQLVLSVSPDSFSSVTRAQIISDFCHAIAGGRLFGAERIMKDILAAIEEKPHLYPLCHWYTVECLRAEMSVETKNRVLAEMREKVWRLGSDPGEFVCDIAKLLQ